MADDTADDPPPVGFEPEVILAQAEMIAACVRHGVTPDDVIIADLGELVAGCSALLNQETFVDVAILGNGLFALAIWELAHGDYELGSELFAYADRFGFVQTLPSFERSWAAARVRPTQIPDGPAWSIRQNARILLMRLKYTSQTLRE